MAMNQFEQVFIQIHLWPWSVLAPSETVDLRTENVEFEFFGSPIISILKGAEIYLSRRNEQFVRLGSPYTSGQHKCRVFETPHGVLAGSDGTKELTIRHEAKSSVIVLDALGAKSRFIENTTETCGLEESPMARMVLGWSQFFDDLPTGVTSTIDGSTADSEIYGANADKDQNQHQVRVPWRKILDLLKTLREQSGEPRKALIVAIADAMQVGLPQVVKGLRRVLLRERRLLPVSRICETDFSCLQWYIRQPGLKTEEKAGNRQEIMGVSRRETLNVHENRVFKDFLSRCRSEARRYLRSEVGEDQALKNSTRGRTVQTFGSLCNFLLREVVFDEVSKPSPGTPPNYVLLNDHRYRQVWQWYCRMLRREEDEDRCWDWQSRTWADISRLLVNSALVFHSQTSPDFMKQGIVLKDFVAGGLKLLNEQKLGCRTHQGTEPGPFMVKCFEDGKRVWHGVMEVVHPDQANDHNVVALLGHTGAHLYLVLRPLGQTPQRLHVILVWGANTAGAIKTPDYNEIADSAYQALIAHQVHINSHRFPFEIRIFGLALCSNDRSTVHEPEIHDGKLVVVAVPADPQQWYDAVEVIGGSLDKIMGLIR